jgi:hypothetical protein
MNPIDSDELNLIRICYDLSARSLCGVDAPHGVVLLRITLKGEQAALLELLPEDIGVPVGFQEAQAKQADESVYQLPDSTYTSLESIIPKGEPLWITFAQPAGYLVVVPWERLLHKRLSVPVLRLPYTTVRPIASVESLDAVLCLSLPVGIEAEGYSPQIVIDSFAGQIPQNLAAHTTIHIFSDSVTLELVNPYVAAFSDRYRVKVYDPAEAAALCPVVVDRQHDMQMLDLENPWLLWMRDAMGDKSADIVHFVCHGYLSRDHGALALAPSPIDCDNKSLNRLVAARELGRFLDEVGAWSVAFSSPPRNFSIAGLRMLQDDMARLRPGPVLFHDIGADVDCTALDQGYRYLYSFENADAPHCDAISLYCHPEWGTLDQQPATEVANSVSEYTLAEWLGPTLQGPVNTPSWIASVQRMLENSVEQMSGGRPQNAGAERYAEAAAEHSEEAEAKKQGERQALKFAADFLGEHAAQWLRDRDKPGDDK